MLVVVRRKHNLITGEWYFSAVDGLSASCLAEVLWGYTWFDASQWDRTLSELKHMFGSGIKMTNRWYHIKRRRELGMIGT